MLTPQQIKNIEIGPTCLTYCNTSVSGSILSGINPLSKFFKIQTSRCISYLCNLKYYKIEPLFIHNQYPKMAETDRRMVRISSNNFQNQMTIDFRFCCWPIKRYVVLRKRTIYIYYDRSHFLNYPLSPLIFFNISNLTILLQQNWLSLSGCVNQIKFFDKDQQKLLDLIQAVNQNKKDINLREIFPKKFKELQQKREEKLNQDVN